MTIYPLSICSAVSGSVRAARPACVFTLTAATTKATGTSATKHLSRICRASVAG